MTQEELYEAIDATIAPNGQRGITAESLAALLKDIAANAGGGGSGQGALRVYGIGEMSLDQALLDGIESTVQGASAPFIALMESNAVVYQQLKEMTLKGEAAPLMMLDKGVTDATLASLYGTEVKVLASAPVALYAEYVDNVLTISLTYEFSVVNINYTNRYVLGEDGSLTYVEAES